MQQLSIMPETRNCLKLSAAVATQTWLERRWINTQLREKSSGLEPVSEGVSKNLSLLGKKSEDNGLYKSGSFRPPSVLLLSFTWWKKSVTVTFKLSACSAVKAFRRPKVTAKLLFCSCNRKEKPLLCRQIRSHLSYLNSSGLHLQPSLKFFYVSYWQQHKMIEQNSCKIIAATHI